jgi:hypothetical protein
MGQPSQPTDHVPQGNPSFRIADARGSDFRMLCGFHSEMARGSVISRCAQSAQDRMLERRLLYDRHVD